MSGIFDDPLFDDPLHPRPEPRAGRSHATDEGVFPGWAVKGKGGVTIGSGLTVETAVKLAIKHSAEIWGYGKTCNKRFPDWPAFKTSLLAYGCDGQLVKTDEWPL